MFPYTKKCILSRGSYPVQLEIPGWSTLTNGEIERILCVASWNVRDISSEVDGYEGGRSVLLKRERITRNRSVPEVGLQVSGVGYRTIERYKGSSIFMAGSGFNPPSTSNFYENVDLTENEGTTTVMSPRGEIQPERLGYAPIGSYSQDRATEKIINTIKAGSLGMRRVVVPRVEAYGRYLDLRYNGGNASFVVFTVPSTSGRFAEQFLREFHGPYKVFAENMIELAMILGPAIRELHDKGKCHRQIHFSNFYVHGHVLYLMDWSTMIGLRGFDPEYRSVDIKIPQQSLENIRDLLFGNMINLPQGDMTLISSSMMFLEALISSYFGRSIDLINLCQQIKEETGITEDVATIIEIIRRGQFWPPVSGKPGRNDLCSCGSGRKYKNCCLKC